MLSNKSIEVPDNLIKLVKKIPLITAGIVCANHSSTITSLRQAHDLNMVNPIFIGNKRLILEEAEKINWNISTFKIINEINDYESAVIGAKLAKKNEIQVLIKGNLHTDTLMKAFLKKEFGLIGTKRLSHIWHMTINKYDKPLEE